MRRSVQRPGEQSLLVEGPAVREPRGRNRILRAHGVRVAACGRCVSGRDGKEQPGERDEAKSLHSEGRVARWTHKAKHEARWAGAESVKIPSRLRMSPGEVYPSARPAALRPCEDVAEVRDFDARS